MTEKEKQHPKTQNLTIELDLETFEMAQSQAQERGLTVEGHLIELISNDMKKRELVDSFTLRDFILNSPLKDSGVDLSRSKAADARATLDFDKECEDGEKL